MKTCKKCGSGFIAGAKYCAKCGTLVPPPAHHGTISFALLVLGLTALLFLAILFGPKLYSLIPQETARPLTYEEKVLNYSFRCRSWIKLQLKDPESFELIESKYLDQGEFFVINIEYRARNSFNGFVRETGTCKVSLNNQIIDGLAVTGKK